MEIAGGLMPARSSGFPRTSASARRQWRSRLTTEGVGETSGETVGQAAEFISVADPAEGRQRSSYVADFVSAVHRSFRVNLNPDVFTDALVSFSGRFSPPIAAVVTASPSASLNHL